MFTQLLSYAAFILFIHLMLFVYQVQNNLCTPKNGEILVASTQDFLTSSFLISRKDTFYDRSTFSLICSYMGDGMDIVDLPTPAIIKVSQLHMLVQICLPEMYLSYLRRFIHLSLYSALFINCVCPVVLIYYIFCCFLRALNSEMFILCSSETYSQRALLLT